VHFFRVLHPLLKRLPSAAMQTASWWRGFAVLVLGCALVGGPASAQELAFLRDGAAVARLSLDQLLAACEPAVVGVDDPYYGRAKRFHAVPLDCVFEQGLGARPAARDNVFLRAEDGYTRPAAGALLASEGAWLAFADADVSTGVPGAGDFAPGWEPIDRRQVEPAPFYLIWSGAGRNDPHRHPWPYQLVQIEVAPLARLFPHVVPPRAEPGSAVATGFAIFRSQCIACHAINGEGGKVGPDLNIPRSIVEYRPVEQIKAYIRNPQSFRYTTMPAHESLSDAELDAVIAYFRAMSRAKHDPAAP
jgi:mono/diheme cytochrome c family protein